MCCCANRMTCKCSHGINAFVETDPSIHCSAQPSAIDANECFICQGSGHWARDCTSLPAEYLQAHAPQCFNCGGRGHYARCCPVKKPQSIKTNSSEKIELQKRTRRESMSATLLLSDWITPGALNSGPQHQDMFPSPLSTRPQSPELKSYPGQK